MREATESLHTQNGTWGCSDGRGGKHNTQRESSIASGLVLKFLHVVEFGEQGLVLRTDRVQDCVKENGMHQPRQYVYSVARLSFFPTSHSAISSMLAKMSPCRVSWCVCACVLYGERDNRTVH